MLNQRMVQFLIGSVFLSVAAIGPPIVLSSEGGELKEMPASFSVTLKKKEDRFELRPLYERPASNDQERGVVGPAENGGPSNSLTDGCSVFVRSRSGIGSLTLELNGPAWPKRLAWSMRTQAVEQLEIRIEDGLWLRASIGHGATQARFQVLRETEGGIQERSLSDDERDWIVARQLRVDGQEGDSGEIWEVEFAHSLYKDSRKIDINWIDYFR